MQALDYEVKTEGKYMTIRPPGYQRGIRLHRLGEGYDRESVKRGILQPDKRGMTSASEAAELPEHLTVTAPLTAAKASAAPTNSPMMKTFRYKSSFRRHPVKKKKGLRALYAYYLYRIGAFPKRHPSARRTAFLLRDDLRRLDKYTAQMGLLCKEKIDTQEGLEDYVTREQLRMNALLEARQRINKNKREAGVVIDDEIRKKELAGEAAAITKQLREIRKKLRLCEEISANSRTFPEKLKAAAQQERRWKQQRENRADGTKRGSDRRNDGRNNQEH